LSPKKTGTIKYEIGIYEGEIENGKANGYGVYKYNNGDRYEG
jgi:hypothetical protein